MNKQSVRKVLDFVLMRQVANTRNLTSLALVAFFFGVYIAAGGKIASVPNLPKGTGFGDIEGLEKNSDENATSETETAKESETIPQESIAKTEDLNNDNDLFQDKRTGTVNARASLNNDEISFDTDSPKNEASPTKESNIESLRRRLENLKRGAH